MKFLALLERVRHLSVIDTPTLRAFGEDPRSLAVQLSRWVASGRLLQLRRGIYQLPAGMRSVDPSPFFLANVLATPSYVSLESALAFHGLIPERVMLTQSVTTRRPETLSTAAGDFEFRHVKRDWFFGYRETAVPGGTALVAEPEKALLDLVHLSRGEFPQDRINELRLDGLDRVDLKRLHAFARRGTPRVRRAAEQLRAWIERETLEGATP